MRNIGNNTIWWGVVHKICEPLYDKKQLLPPGVKDQVWNVLGLMPPAGTINYSPENFNSHDQL